MDILPKEVSELTIERAYAKEVLSQEKAKEEFKRLGLTEFIETKDTSNLVTALRIIENYNFNKELSDNEKSALLYCILNNENLNNVHRILLIRLEKEFETIGLSKQETYQALINLGVNSSITKQTGYDYNSLLRHKNRIGELKRIELENPIVSNITIMKAEEKTFDKCRFTPYFLQQSSN